MCICHLIDSKLSQPLIHRTLPKLGVAHFVADQGIRVVKNTCPVDGSTKRAYAKQLMEQINRETPGAKDRIMHAIVNGRFPDWPL